MELPLIIVSLGILIFSAVFHEVAHGWVADRLGDPTARLLGRLTLNPIPHIDPVMSIFLPLVLLISGSPVIFGAAKPVPVDPFNLKDGRRDMALVAAAGPITNFLIASVAALLFNLAWPNLPLSSALFVDPFESIPNLVLMLTSSVIYLNLLLGIFNLLPIPPLDGSKIFALILPEDTAKKYLSIGNLGMFILFFLLIFPIGGLSLSSLISKVLDACLNVLSL